MLAMVIGALPHCQAHSSLPDARDRAAALAVTKTVLTTDDVEKAAVLDEGRGYRVVADPPATIGTRRTSFLGMISATEVFGTLREQTGAMAGAGDVVVLDVPSGTVTSVASLRAGRDVVGMAYSDRFVVWSESPPAGLRGSWAIRSFDRSTGGVRTLATAGDVGVGRPSLADPEGGVPHISGDDAIFVAGDSGRLPTTATAYRVPLDGSAGPRRVARDVRAAYPIGDRLAVLRDGRFSSLDLYAGTETDVEPRRGSTTCPGFEAQGVYVLCDTEGGARRLTIVQPGGDVTEIHLSGSGGGAATTGPTYFGASRDWVTFTHDDRAYVLDLGSKKLGRFTGAQFVSGSQSAGNTIRYGRTDALMTEALPAPFVELDLR
jgi:hypothetical protein